jgi:hypothetical protein
MHEQRDVAAAASVLDEDYALLLVQPARAAMPRDRWLETLPDYVVHDYAVEDEIVDLDDDIAVVLHRDRMGATVLGVDRSGTFVITDVWRRRGNDWRIWRRHSTPLTAGELPGVTDR